MLLELDTSDREWMFQNEKGIGWSSGVERGVASHEACRGDEECEYHVT